jgi:NitT/TauT family transport system substrate-binding protein
MIILLSFLFLFCIIIQLGYGKEPIPSTRVKLKVVSLPYVSFAPLYIAQEEGYFTEQDLHIEFVKMAVAADSLPSLIKGDLDVIAETLFPGFLNAIVREAKIKFVADKGYHSSEGCTYSAIMARRTLVEEGKLNSISQLKGCRISMIQDSALSAYYLEGALNQANLSFNDVEMVFLPMPSRLEAFERGAIDITTATEPWVTRMLQTGHVVIWKPIQKLFPNFQHAVLLYGPTLIEKNPDAGKKFMVAYLRAVRQYNQGKTKRNLEILAKYIEMDRRLLGEVCWPTIRSSGQIHIRSVMDYQTWAMKKGYLDKQVPPNQFWDPSFIEYANKILDSDSR